MLVTLFGMVTLVIFPLVGEKALPAMAVTGRFCILGGIFISAAPVPVYLVIVTAVAVLVTVKLLSAVYVCAKAPTAMSAISATDKNTFFFMLKLLAKI